MHTLHWNNESVSGSDKIFMNQSHQRKDERFGAYSDYNN